MCKKLAIFPAFTLILTFLLPKQAFAARPELTNQQFAFKISQDVDLEAGFIKKSEAENASEPINLINTELAQEPEVKQITKAKKKTVAAYNGNKTFTVLVTGYSSTVDQCDADPFTTASGKRVHTGTVAANFLPFGTFVKFPDYFGDQIFVVEDRMAKRFSDRVDVWFETRTEALQFGARKLTAVVVTK